VWDRGFTLITNQLVQCRWTTPVVSSDKGIMIQFLKEMATIANMEPLSFAWPIARLPLTKVCEDSSLLPDAEELEEASKTSPSLCLEFIVSDTSGHEMTHMLKWTHPQEIANSCEQLNISLVCFASHYPKLWEILMLPISHCNSVHGTPLTSLLWMYFVWSPSK
jgi:hypothetical protein